MRQKVFALVGFLILAGCLPQNLFAGSEAAGHATVAPAFVEARSEAKIGFRHLRPGDTVRGKVARDVFFADQLVVPSGSAISLTVSRLERRRRGRSAVLPWPVRYLRPKYARHPVFDFADVTLAGGARVRLRVAAVSLTHEVRFTSRTKGLVKADRSKTSSPAKASQEGGGKPSVRLRIVVESASPETSGVASTNGRFAAPRGTAPSSVKTVDAGTEARLALLGSLSSSKSRAGDSFQALLIEPVRLNSDLLLPQGTVFEGRVVTGTPARRLSRRGSLHLTFNRLILPSGSSIPIAASLAGVGVDQQSALKMNSEGGLAGARAGRKRVLVELGIGVAISKVVDDTFQLVAEAVVSTATDASTAGTARLIGFAVTGVYWLTRRGRDVRLPPYTTFTIRFDRPPVLPASVLAP
jgi:hypothetical protein